MKKYYDLINTLPLSLLMMLLFGAEAGIPSGSIPAFVLCIVFTLWIVLLRNMKRRECLRSIGIVSVFVLVLFQAAGEKYRELFIEKYLWILWLLGFSGAALAAAVILDKSIWLRRLSGAAMLVFLVAGTVMGMDIGKAVFALVCFFLLIRLSEEVQRRWTKSGYPDIREHITRISPFLLGLCLMVYIIPAISKPYDWQFAKNIYNTAAAFANRVYGYISHSSDQYGKIGFSDKGGFLSGLSGGSDEEILSISADNPEIKDFRLVGCMSGDFRGREWVFDIKTAGNSRMLDTMETSTAVRKQDSAARFDYIQKVEMDYRTLFYNTKYIFAPAKTRLAASVRKTSRISEKHGSLISKHRMNYKDEYQVSCYVINYANPELEDFLTTAGDISEDEWKQTAYAEDITGKTGYAFEDYQRYRRSVYDEYCRSYGLTGETAEIINGIKDSAANRYEALKELEAYLRTLTYSTDCGPLPDSVTDAQSFLDYFLFSSKKGYCMHFATAFTLMAGEMGIPCRYVQGYNVTRASDGSITVKNSNAHAWPEAYFDNVGWVAFEPTPLYPVLAGWQVRNRNNGGYGRDDHRQEPSTAPSAVPETQEVPAEEEEKIDPLIFIIPSLAVIGFLLLFYFISLSLSRRKYRRMNCSDRFRYLAQQYLRLMSYLGLRMQEDETLAEFESRALNSGKEEIKPHLGFIRIYETILYSDTEASEEDIKQAESINRALRTLVKKGKLKYRLMLLLKKQ